MNAISVAKGLLTTPACTLEQRLYSSGIWNRTKLTLPHFLVLGSGHAGTSWLHDNLNRHPDCFLPEQKETHYFSREFERRPLRYYASLFEAGKDKIRGEATPVYTLLKPDRIRFIRSILPDVRLIIIVRNPVDRAWSACCRVITRVAEHLGTTFDEIDDAEIYGFLRHEWAYRPERGLAGYYEPGLLQGEYTRAIDKWLLFYPDEQLLVCFFDEMKKDPKRFLSSICAHIGASTDIDWDSLPLFEAVNTNPSYQPLPERFRAFLDDLYGDEIAALKERFPQQTRAWP
jgi:hypothetical protein